MTPRSFMLAALAPAALALVLPHAAHASDPRIREVAYTPLSVTALHGCAGFQSTVAFEPGERIENVALGDAKLWDAVPNKRSDLLFLKPAVHSGRTNMMVVTDRRRYAFDLIARDDAGCRADRATYELQFTYAADPTPPAPPTLADITPPALAALAPPPEDALPAPSARNTAYTFTGTAANVPERAFDDGHSTYLHWADGASAPAIYALGPDKTETLLNYIIKGDYLVVDGVGPAFVLRRGSAVAVLYNDAYQKPKLDADAPRPRGEASTVPAKPSLLARLFGSTTPSQETGR